MKKKFKKGIAAVLAAVCAYACVCIYIHSSATSNIYMSWIFEDNQIDWTPLYGNANMTIEEEESGNRYLKLSYNGNYNRNRAYYDVKVADITASSGVINVSYDLMYLNNDTAKDGDLQFKYRTGPGSAETAMVARFGKNMNTFRNEYGTVKNLSNQNAEFEIGRWYSVKVAVDLDNAVESYCIYDRDTWELIAYGSEVATYNGNTEINMITFSSGTDICLDEVYISNSSSSSAQIYGEPYVSKATKTKYHLVGTSGYMPPGEVTWSLETPRTGVSVDSPTARIIVGSNPEPGPVILRADKETSDGTSTYKYVVYVTK